MKGQSNAIAKSGAGYERLFVTLTSNQSETLVAKVTVAYDDVVQEKDWEGGVLRFEIPQYKSYTISFSDVDGYKTPSSVERMASSDSNYLLEATYYGEKVTVNVSSDNGESMDGKKVTINGKQYSVKSGKVSVIVPFDTAYTISAEGVFGFATPGSQNVTAALKDREVSLVYKVNLLKVNMASNQAGESISLKATVSYNGTSVQVSNGETIKIPSSTNVTITYPALANYSTPASQTVNAAYGLTEKNATYSTEVVTVTVTADEGVSVAGQVVTINGNAYTLDSTGVATQKVPYGTSYSISLNAKTNYTTPSTITRTAQSVSYAVTMNYALAMETLTVNVTGISSGFTVSVINATTGATIGSQTTASKTYSILQGTKYYVKGNAVSNYITPNNSATRTAVAGASHSVTMTYTYHKGTLNPSNGVYIQDTDGFFHTESAWDGTYTPNGVAVVTSNCRFVIALEDAYNGTCKWGSDGSTSSVLITTNETEALNDFVGEQNTTALYSGGYGYSGAIYYCKKYTFPNNGAGYLGAAGEWKAVVDNLTAITSALNKCGGTPMQDTYYWTSTQYGSTSSWKINLDNSVFNAGIRKTSTDTRARAFCSI